MSLVSGRFLGNLRLYVSGGPEALTGSRAEEMLEAANIQVWGPLMFVYCS